MFKKLPLNEVVRIDTIISVHCFDYASNFRFHGDCHDFWELVFVDSGEVGIMSNERTHILHANQAILHAPGVYHNIWANGIFASVIILAFDTASTALNTICAQVMDLDDKAKKHLSSILQEAVNTYEGPLNLINQKEMVKSTKSNFGSEQIIKTHIEQLFIDFIRSKADESNNEGVALNSIKYDKLVEQIIEILKKNIEGTIDLDTICEQTNYSKTYIKTYFKKATGDTIYQTYLRMKIKYSKILICEEDMSVTEISEKLSFTSVNYFCRIFKKITGMTAVEYKNSVKKSALL